jgi:hypothetical protein
LQSGLECQAKKLLLPYPTCGSKAWIVAALSEGTDWLYFGTHPISVVPKRQSEMIFRFTGNLMRALTPELSGHINREAIDWSA